MTGHIGKRSFGDGGIDERGPGRYRLRYRHNGKRYSKAFKGSIGEARKELRRLVRSGETDQHVDPARVTLEHWITQWLALLDRNADEADTKRKRGLINARTHERYDQLLTLHIIPTLGDTALQKLTGTAIDNCYIALEGKLATRTVSHVHVTLKACLAAAVRKRLILRNPAEDAEAPVAGESNVAKVLDEKELTALVRGFSGHPLAGIVTVAACTGARRNEILALRWSDVDLEGKTISITRSIEETAKYGRRVKEPKTERGRRTIAIDDSLIVMLRGYLEKHKRLIAGVADNSVVDLSLISVPPDALLFPGGDGSDLFQLRDAHAVTRSFGRHSKKVGFSVRFHDLRASHLTILLDRGVPVHVVAARGGHDPAVLLKSYARRTKKSDTSAADIIGTISKGMIG